MFSHNGRLAGARLRPLEVLLGHLIGQFETAENAADRAGLALYQQLKGPGRARIEAIGLAHDKDRHLAEVRHALGIDIAQTLEIAVVKTDGGAKLAQLHPVEDAATHVTRALERIAAAAQHGNRLLARLERLHQKTVLVVAEQIAADGRRIQVRGVKVDKGVVDLLGRSYLDPFGFAALERLVDLTTGQVQAANGSVPRQLGPVGRL